MTSRRRKPLAERYQTAIATSVLVLLITGTIVGIGWYDGYWSKPQSQPSRQEAQR